MFRVIAFVLFIVVDVCLLLGSLDFVFSVCVTYCLFVLVVLVDCLYRLIVLLVLKMVFIDLYGFCLLLPCVICLCLIWVLVNCSLYLLIVVADSVASGLNLRGVLLFYLFRVLFGVLIAFCDYGCW